VNYTSEQIRTAAVRAAEQTTKRIDEFPEGIITSGELLLMAGLAAPPEPLTKEEEARQCTDTFNHSGAAPGIARQCGAWQRVARHGHFKDTHAPTTTTPTEGHLCRQRLRAQATVLCPVSRMWAHRRATPERERDSTQAQKVRRMQEGGDG